MTVKVGMTRSRSYEIDPREWNKTTWTDEVLCSECTFNVSITFYSSAKMTLIAGEVEDPGEYIQQYWGVAVDRMATLAEEVSVILAEIADFLDIHSRHLLPLERKIINDLPPIVIKERGRE